MKALHTLVATLLSTAALSFAPATAYAQRNTPPARIGMTRAQVFGKLAPLGFKFAAEAPYGNGRLAISTAEAPDRQVSVASYRGQAFQIRVAFSANPKAPADAPENHAQDLIAVSRALFPKWLALHSVISDSFQSVHAAASTEAFGPDNGAALAAGAVGALLMAEAGDGDVQFVLEIRDARTVKLFKPPQAAAPAVAQGLVAAPEPVATAQPAAAPAPTAAAAPVAEAPPAPAQNSGASVPPIDAWTCPDSHPYKGNRNSMIYHPPGGTYYKKTKPEECFATAEDAVRAGYRAPKR